MSVTQTGSCSGSAPEPMLEDEHEKTLNPQGDLMRASTSAIRSAGILSPLSVALVATLSALLLPAGTYAQAQDWSGWRGPGRDGIANVIDLPNEWPAELRRPLAG